MKRRPPRPLIALLVLALFATVGYLWWRSRSETTIASKTLSGVVETRTYQVSAPMAATVTAVQATEGARVAKGATLLRLDTRSLDLQITQAKQGVTAARAAVTKAQDDGTSADVAAARARLAQAQAAVSLATVQRSNAVVTAPHGGTIITVSTNAGQTAAPGRTLVTLIDPADLYVRVYIPEPQLVDVKVGGKATVTACDTRRTGTISFVAAKPEFTPNTVETEDQRTKLVYEVRIRVSDPSGALKPGLPVDVTVP